MYDPNIWWHFFQFLIFMALSSLFLFVVFENTFKVRNLFFWLGVLVYTIITSGIIALTLTEISPYRNFSMIGINAIIIVSIVFIKLIIRKNTFSLLFLFFVFLNVQYNTLLLSYATFGYGTIPKPIAYEPANVLILALIYDAILFPVIYYLLVKLYKRVIDERIDFKGLELFFLLPAGFFFAVLLLMFMSKPQPESGMSELLLPLLMINICAFGSYFAVLKSVIASYDAAKKREELYAIEMKQTLLEEQCENLQAKIASDTRTRHDWRHHIITIAGFVDKEDLNGLSEYLTEYKEKYLFAEAPTLCNIEGLDMLFQYYKRKAADLGICLTINTVVFDPQQVPVSDLIVIFGNLLANAIEACGRMKAGQKYINLKIRNHEGNLIGIICENSFDGVINKSGNKFLSRKKDGGIGIASIEAVAQKNHGIVQIKVNGGQFKVYVALKTVQ